MCRDCWPLMTVAIKVVDTALRGKLKNIVYELCDIFLVFCLSLNCIIMAQSAIKG